MKEKKKGGKDGKGFFDGPLGALVLSMVTAIAGPAGTAAIHPARLARLMLRIAATGDGKNGS